jgi:hypothetical protein
MGILLARHRNALLALARYIGGVVGVLAYLIAWAFRWVR